jgi:hypothetical protein
MRDAIRATITALSDHHTLPPSRFMVPRTTAGRVRPLRPRIAVSTTTLPA